MSINRKLAIISSILFISSAFSAAANPIQPKRFSDKSVLAEPVVLPTQQLQEKNRQKTKEESQLVPGALFKLRNGEEMVLEHRLNESTVFIVTSERVMFLIGSTGKEYPQVRSMDMSLTLPDFLDKNDRIVGAALSADQNNIYLLMRSGKAKLFALGESTLNVYWDLALADSIGACKSFVSCNGSNGWTGFVCKDLSVVIWLSSDGKNLEFQTEKLGADAWKDLSIEVRGCGLYIGDTQIKQLESPKE